jgi:uncharacterized membrane protein YsdA (DUF1294 family)
VSLNEVVVTTGWPRLLLAAVYAVMSAIAFAVYAADKAAARRGGWRTPESGLHLLTLFGGWPGALLAQAVFRHKTRKQPFRTIFWATIVLNCLALAWLLTVLPSARG